MRGAVLGDDPPLVGAFGRGVQRLEVAERDYDRVGIRAACRGERQLVGNENVPVDVPAGVSSGSRIRYAGRGNTDPETGKSGDLFVVTNVAEDPFFRRVGDNLYCTVSVSGC